MSHLRWINSKKYFNLTHICMKSKKSLIQIRKEKLEMKISEAIKSHFIHLHCSKNRKKVQWKNYCTVCFMLYAFAYSQLESDVNFKCTPYSSIFVRIWNEKSLIFLFFYLKSWNQYNHHISTVKINYNSRWSCSNSLRYLFQNSCDNWNSAYCS